VPATRPKANHFRFGIEMQHNLCYVFVNILGELDDTRRGNSERSTRCQPRNRVAEIKAMPIPLSPETRRRLDLLFRPKDRADAVELLVKECGNNLPFLEKLDEYQLERFRFAALKISGGDLNKLYRAVELAQRDWRDLLVAAGFGDDVEAHNRWLATTNAGEISP
jgi:hypothetical protein